MTTTFAGALDGIRALVVDDEADVRLGLTRLVASTGARVAAAASGEEALEQIEHHDVDIVISDVRMNGMSGIDLLKKILARKPRASVMLITGYGTIRQAVEALQLGATHFLAKPFDNDELVLNVLRMGRGILAERLVTQHRVASAPDDAQTLIARDPRMCEALALLDQAAATRVPVLIQGESGTGKELVARAVHRRSAAASRRFLAVNCAALPDTLIESELFGYRKGAFTGAHRDHRGIFSQCDGGSIFLDEVPSMSLSFQGKLLRVLQERVVRPLGGVEDEKTDFRLICATNRDLRELVKRGEFREDLFYRLCVVEIHIPPLRDRPADIPELARTFLRRAAHECLADASLCPGISNAAMEELTAHRWSGNVRELENTIQRALIACPGPQILPHHLNLRDGMSPGAVSSISDDALAYDDAKERTIERFQRQFIARILERTGGNISKAAAECGLTRAAIQKIMKTLKMEREDFTKG